MSLKTVGVKFKSGNAGNSYGSKIYEYLTEYDVKKGDVAVVESPSDGFVTVEIVTVTEGTKGKATKYLVQIVDPSDYISGAERRAKRAAIVRQLEAKKKQVEELQVYKWLADNDSEAADLLKQLQNL